MQTKQYKERTRRRIGTTFFFGGLLLLGLLLTRDYGMGWDEPVEREAGYISLRYVVRVLAPQLLDAGHLANLPELRTYHDADHGVAFQLPPGGAGGHVLPPRFARGVLDAAFSVFRHVCAGHLGRIPHWQRTVWQLALGAVGCGAAGVLAPHLRRGLP
jgi:hypothetical protein